VDRWSKKRRIGVAAALLAGTIAVLAFGGVGGAAPLQDVQHGIATTKGCVSPTAIGSGYACSYQIINIDDDAHDTVTADGLVDTVQTATGPLSSGNVFSALRIVFVQGTAVTPPFCVGGGGAGTLASPYTGATLCTIPFGARIGILPFSFYTVQPADFNLPGNVLTDSASVSWHDLCDDPAGTGNSNCSPNPPPKVGRPRSP